MPALQPYNRYVTDFFLLLINGLIVYHLWVRNGDRRLWMWLAAAFAFTFGVEAVGVATGAVFGEYVYGDTMLLQWLGVPFVIALNWCVLTLATNDLALRFLPRPVAAAVVASILLALYDVVIEPVAIHLDYWRWSAVEVPLQNYLAWAVVALVISLPLQLLGIRFRSPVLPVYLVVQFVYFLVLNIFL